MERVTKQNNTKTFSARGGKFGKKTRQKLFDFKMIKNVLALLWSAKLYQLLMINGWVGDGWTGGL